MNNFELTFFKKYIPEWQKIEWIIHIHFIEIFNKLFLWISMGALLPSFLYYYSERLKILVPFYYLEGLLILIFIKVVYEIFNWYNDVWIITDNWVVSLEWALFKTNTISVVYEKIEWLEVEQWWISDKLLKKWNLVIHKFWEDSLTLINAINPYAWVDLIEEISEKATETNNLEDDKFDIIMDALGWVVENYLWKKMSITEKQEELNAVISKIEKNEWTIDLR
jgi:hypothetical protein